MDRFVLAQNIARYRRMLASAIDDDARHTAGILLAEAERELDLLERVWRWSCPHLDLPDPVWRGLAAHLDQAVDRLHADRGTLQLWDTADDALCLVGFRNFTRPVLERMAQTRPGENPACDLALRTRRPVCVEDIEKEDGFAMPRSLARSAGVRAMMITPLFSPEGVVLGLLSTHFRNSRTFRDEDRALCANIAGNAAELLVAHAV